VSGQWHSLSYSVLHSVHQHSCLSPFLRSYIHDDPGLVPLLEMLRASGKKLFVVRVLISRTCQLSPQCMGFQKGLAACDAVLPGL